MSRFVRQVSFETEFDGDNVTMKLSPMHYGDMAKLQPESSGKVDAARFIEVVREILPKYVTEFAGLKDSEGADLSFDIVVEQAYFVDLLQRIAVRLIRLSTPQGMVEEKPT